MTIERPQGPAEIPPLVEPAVGAAPHPTALRMQILTTEHWSLLSSRSLAWSETFSRASMYLSTLSGALVALSLVAGIDHFGTVFTTVALVVLPVVLFIGYTTWLRMYAANYHDAMAVMGMNRIRGAYLALAPDLEPIFVMGTTDDPVGMTRTMAVPPRLSPVVHLVSATPSVINVLNSVVAGALTGIVAVSVFGLPTALGAALGVAAGVAQFAVQVVWVRRNIGRLQSDVRPLPSRGGPG
jgi:hypothetical protein